MKSVRVIPWVTTMILVALGFPYTASTEFEARLPGLQSPAYYTYAMWQDYMATLTNAPDLSWSIIGNSVQRRPLYKIVIEDPSSPDAQKQFILLTGRQHGDESIHNYILEGMIDYVIGRGTTAPPADLLQRMSFVIYPFMNPDGAVRRSRSNAQGHDLNRGWVLTGCDPGQPVETYLVQCDIEQFEATADFRMGIDLHGWLREFDAGFRFTADTPGLLPGYYENQDGWFRIVESIDPWRSYQNWQQNSGTPGMMRWALYHRYALDIHTTETNDRTTRSVESLRQEGELYIDAIYDYLCSRRFTDEAGNKKNSYNMQTDLVYVTVKDLDENTSPLTQETIEVVITTSMGGDTETLTLVETGNNTGIFRNPVGLRLSQHSAITGNGVIELLPGAMITVSYTDDDLPQDNSTDTAIITVNQGS